MRHFKPVLNSKGLLAASMAMLSGQALAEVAGRVSFVSGDAVVSAADGNSRILKRGDAINGGDRITTRAGRVQVRFTDGGFVSLQPNTVFGVDEYLYTSRKPEETSLFFSLVQGGMRTITGAIGKVNKKSYQVRTPVATIGIRGTEYLARVSEKGLIVSVGSGFVNVANNRGNITAGAGQNIQVRGLEEQPSLGTEQAAITASGANGDQEEEEGETEQQNESGDTGDTGDTVAIANVQNERGDYLFLFTTSPSLPDSVPPDGPYYMLTSPKLLSSAEGSVFFADFDQNGSVTGTGGGLIKLYDNDAVSHFDTDTLKVVNSGTISSLSWGEFTNGSTGTNGLFEYCAGVCTTGPFTLTDTEFMPYIVGAPAPGNLSKGTATYTLQGATPARSADGSAGRVDRFSITVNLDFSTIEADLQVTMPGKPLLGLTQGLTSDPLTYNVNTNGPVGILNLGTAARFSLDSSMLQVTGSTGACASAGSCSAAIKGFFAGAGASQIGAAYKIDDSMNNAFISGVAALGMVGYNSSTLLNSGTGYTAAYAAKSSASVSGGFTGFDTSTLPPIYTDNSLTATFGSDNLLLRATQAGGSVTTLDRGTSALATNQGQAGALTWGRWYTTSSATTTVSGSPLTLGANDSLHYVTGSMTQPNIFIGINQAYGYGATATYTYQGGTTATGSDGRTGIVTSDSTLLVAFGPNRVDLNVGIDMSSGNDYRLGGSAFFGSGGSASFQAAGSGGPGCTVIGSGGCGASVSGFFAGQQAQQIGLGYSISDFSGSEVNGAAAFGRGGITPPPVGPAL